MRLFDAHNHVCDARLAADAAGVRERALASGVIGMACNGTEPADWPAVEQAAREGFGVTPCYGLHPWRVRAVSGGAWLDDVCARLEADPRSAVGEIGLDHAPEVRDDAAQEPVFLAQYRLSIDLRRPVTIHCRRAWGRLMELLAPFGPHPRGMVIHSYGGGVEPLEALTRLNAFFSFSGSLTFDRNLRGRRAAAAVSEDRLLIETDAPDIGMAGLPETAPTEPAHLARVCRVLAEVRGVAGETVAEQTTANAERLFHGGAGGRKP